MIYLIVNEEEGFCKIGYSNNPKKRLQTLQIGCPFPLTLAATMKGNIQDERALHKKFEHLFVRGEWVNYTAEIHNYFKVPVIKHIKIYKGANNALFKLSRRALGLLNYIFSIMDESNLIQTNNYDRKQYNKYLKEINQPTNSDSNILKAIKELVETECLIKIRRGTYIVNPEFFIIGSEKNRLDKIKILLEFQAGTRTPEYTEDFYRKNI